MTVTPELRDKVSKALASKRDLTASTLRTYTSLLSNVLSKLDEDSPAFFEKNVSRVLKHIDSLDKPQTRKTILSALVVLTGNDDYSKAMLENVATVAKQYREQKVDPERVAKLLTPTQIREIHEHWLERCGKEGSPEAYVNCLITGLMSGYYEGTPPRRLTDYSEMKWHSFNRQTDNHMLPEKTPTRMVFHVYKTSASDRDKGIKGVTVPIPPKMTAILKKWRKMNPTAYPLVNTKMEKFTPSSLNKRLNVLFGFGVDMLRSIFLTDMYKDVPKIKTLEDTAASMSHSVQSAMKRTLKWSTIVCVKW